MATIEDNINQMARLVANVKKVYRLNESTIMRIVDMNIALAQQGAQSFQPDEDMPLDMPEPVEDEESEGQLIMFPNETTEEEEN